MASLEAIRHTLAHLLAMAAKEFDPKVQLGIGPTTDDGFYYDFKFSKAPTPDDFKTLEQAMRKLVNKKLPMSGREINQAEGATLFADQPFKLELLNEYAGGGKTLTAYTVGDFTDLCKGGHVENTGEIDAGSFTLTRVAGAYWRGDEKNPQLTRIYGMAFESKDALLAHEKQLEEAKKRDHRKLGKELGLFVFSDLVGPGLPLWTPRGTIIRELLNDYVWELRKARGYQKVTIPHITKKSLYETSGHWAKYADDLLTPVKEKQARARQFEKLVTRYEQLGRPDLACEARLRLTEYQVDAKDYKTAAEGLSKTIAKFPSEGRYVPKMLTHLQTVCGEYKGGTDKLAKFYLQLLPMIPATRGTDVSDFCIKVHEQALEFFKKNGKAADIRQIEVRLATLKRNSSKGS